MEWFKKCVPYLGLTAFVLVALYFIVGVLFLSSELLFPLFSRYAYPIRGLFDVCTIIATIILPIVIISAIHGETINESLCFFKSKWLNLLLIAVTVVGTINIPFAYFDAGTTQIGSFFERRVYSEEYYVEINSNKIQATIFRSHNSQGVVYILERMQLGYDTAYFTFTESLDYMPSWEIDYIVPGIKTVVTTDEGRSFAVTLTAEKVK